MACPQNLTAQYEALCQCLLQSLFFVTEEVLAGHKEMKSFLTFFIYYRLKYCVHRETYHLQLL